MNFTRIEYFLAAAKYLNFTKAANVLYISQPSLSKQIAILEDELNVSLFDRMPRNLQLTPAGKLLYQEFNKMMPEIDAIAERVTRTGKNRFSSLVIGCVESAHLGKTAATAIRSYIEKTARVELFIERYGFKELHNKVLDGTIDAAFTLSNQIGELKGISWRTIEHRQRYIILSVNHRLAARDEVRIEDLKGETLILHGNSEPMALCDDILDECMRLGFDPKIRYAPDVNALLDYIELTDGIAFMDKSIVTNRLGRLKYYPTKLDKQFEMICIWSKKNKNTALRDFIKFLPEELPVGI